MADDAVRSSTYFAQIPEWVLFHPRLTTRAIQVYGALARYADGGRAWPGITKLSERCHCSYDAAARALRELETVGAIDTEQRFRDDGSRTTNSYFLHRTPRSLPRADAGAGSGVDAGAGGRENAGAKIQSQIDPELFEPETTKAPSEISGADALAEDHFKQFWNTYPRKIGKPLARTAYARALKRAEPAKIAMGLLRWVDYWKADARPQFIPHPTTWLNQDRWDDRPGSALNEEELAAKMKERRERGGPF